MFHVHCSYRAQLSYAKLVFCFASVQGDKWHSRRKILTPAFHFKILEEFIHVFNANSEFLVKDLGNHVEEPFVDINFHITKCTLDIICGKYQFPYCQVYFRYCMLFLTGPVSEHQTDIMTCLQLLLLFCTSITEFIYNYISSGIKCLYIHHIQHKLTPPSQDKDCM